jgi:Tfp pilus assembly pilus retraction ATPase PilT
VLVTGATGSGKSTTLAAMIDFINATMQDHIITIEDPIEFVHRNKRCLVNQREVGTDTQGFNSALRRVLRQDPDIVLIGEMRDKETIEAGLTLAETGLCHAAYIVSGRNYQPYRRRVSGLSAKSDSHSARFRVGRRFLSAIAAEDE